MGDALRNALTRRSVLIAAATSIAAASSAHAGQCLEDLRVIGQNAVRLRDYRCRINSGEIRVQLQRLEHIAAASIFNGTIPSQLSSIMGQPRIVANDVL